MCISSIDQTQIIQPCLMGLATRVGFTLDVSYVRGLESGTCCVVAHLKN